MPQGTRCVPCGAALDAGAAACPLCGYVVKVGRSESNWTLTRVILLMIPSGLLLFLVAALAIVLVIRGRLTGNRVYRDALELARSSDKMKEMLGQPIKEGWWAFGEIRSIDGSGFAEWTTDVKGPKGRGRLHCVANRVGASWWYSQLMFVSEDGKRTLDVTPAPTRDALVLAPSPKKIYLVPMGGIREETLAWAPAYYRAKLDVNVEVLPPITLKGNLWNARRRQLIAEKLVERMKQALPEKVKDQSTVLIGVTGGDMYIGSYDWSYAVNYREDGRFAVVSAARLHPAYIPQKWNLAMGISRLQKMISKNMYLLCFGVPLSNDSTSAVSGGVMSAEEIDPMSDEIIGAEGRWDPQETGTVPMTNMILSRDQPVAWNMEWSSKPPEDMEMEGFVAHLGSGILIQRKTDFYLDGEFPVQLVRTYASQDNVSREFGVGTHDSLDISLAGEPGNYLELALENGQPTRFKRDVASDKAGLQAYRGEVNYSNSFSQGMLFVKGFDSDIGTTDGWHYFFPYRPRVASEEKLAILTGYSDPQGRRYEMDRNGAGDLLSLKTPGGKWLHFECDAQHRYRRIEDSDGRELDYEYDPEGRLTGVVDAKGESEFYRYDEKNQMREVVDRRGKVLMTVTYAPDGWLSSQTLEDGRSFRYEYQKEAGGRLEQVRFTDPNGYVTLFHHAGKRYRQSLPSQTATGSERAAEPFLN